jgi:hypothetical protein
MSSEQAGASHNLETGTGIDFHWPAFSWGQQVTIVDRTQPWPVNAATSNWNTAFDPGLVHYHWWNCRHGVNCATITEIDDSSKGWIGATWHDWDSDGHLQNPGTYAKLNEYWVRQLCGGPQEPSKSDCRRHTACHEIGHIMGLNHQGGPSCLDESLTELGT